ncbi:MAG: Serine/threonine-protein kinase PrkC [Candidatus Accumulibacter regalis]|jgi:serine/threonine protein kinase|uniref:Serine/threonine-protein kinase PrkC n=1 Tax=Accumulibacter regalis TaxID=522306 RepID=A0A011QJI5_ACCRE|nr:MULTISPECIES: serine/threonine-protein kinase [unclassified Candidatus Accumulibacter]EXI89210.1 MAG: Serine/threonine-protein kinase PrkC [Candidatus Accumulibacter regalis]MQM34287.1 serine/threonine protein kinase [Candidatus Accumulibacter phosphatis]MBL8368170.1 protein kinase [Accumulibacter sp.]MBN8514006.1 protein kinase [Accumulibacter sp.]MBO3701446.1 protein kinase [Accumulibacter sp.]
MTEKIGKYQIIRTLGKGATAVVYLAEDPDLNRQVAIKLIRFGKDSAAMSRRLRKIFQTEDAIGRRLDHPNIVKVYDAVVEKDQAYLVMEFVDGGALDRFCSINRLLPMHRVIGIIFKCCLALDHAFRQGVVHRDIKPANILLDADDNPRITDFGLGLNLQKDMGQDSTFVMGVGSPAYMSPEQVKNYPLNHKTDLYSLGVLLFQLLTGRLPFRANNPATLVYKIVNMDSPSVCALNPNLPAGLDAIIKKSLEKDLYSRYRNGAAFAKDLSAVRYQMLDEDQTQQDLTHFQTLRKLDFFVDFEDIELWEVLRISRWQEITEKVTLIREGDTHRKFGVIIDGFVEVSTNGRVICRLGSSDVIGEMTFLHPTDTLRHATVVTLERTLFLEVNSAALELASDELRERFNKVLLTRVLARLRDANKVLAKLGQTAVQGSFSASSLGLTPPLELL